MNAILGAIGPVFWGLLLLSALVFIHEGGHFLAARVCGVRVLEFFLGMPCRFRIARKSKRIGTTFGVTPLLIGGYAEISGMDPTDVPMAPRVLALIHRCGVTNSVAIATELGISVEEAEDACVHLYNMGSIIEWEAPAVNGGEFADLDAPAGRDSGGVGEDERDTPDVDGGDVLARALWVATPARDPKGFTVFDGRLFDRARASMPGEAWGTTMTQDQFYAFERSRTYAGVGFWKRAFMLIAGIAVNIITGFLLVIFVYSVLGINVPLNISAIGDITEGSAADMAGLQVGDHIVSVDGAAVGTWDELISSMQEVKPESTVKLEIWSPDDREAEIDRLSGSDVRPWDASLGSERTVDVTLGEDGMLGIGVPQATIRLDPLTSCQGAISSIVMTAQSVASLLNPQHTIEVLDNSTSVVGISVMSAQAAEAGASSFLELAAMISFSLAFMNLLPIPPLDGGKLVIEVVQAVTGREVPIKVQTGLSIVGIVLFGLLFIYMLFNDIVRFF